MIPSFRPQSLYALSAIGNVEIDCAYRGDDNERDPMPRSQHCGIVCPNLLEPCHWNMLDAGHWAEMKETRFIRGISISSNSIGTNDCWMARLMKCQMKVCKEATCIPTACMLWFWNREPTMVSQIMTDGILRVWSSRAVNLRTSNKILHDIDRTIRKNLDPWW